MFKSKTKNGLFIWETALLLALCITLVYGLYEQSRQRELSRQVIRLHVVARSDSERDQAIKLKVRDDILTLLEPELKDASGPEEAAERIQGLLPAIEAAAGLRAACPVRASLAEEGFPTRDYEGFSLPAGRYLALRVVLGEGAGHNWWCVVFPPLCSAAAEDIHEAVELLDPDSGELITAGAEGYRVSFRILELFQELRERLG